jgi:hypothetical protein
MEYILPNAGYINAVNVSYQAHASALYIEKNMYTTNKSQTLASAL